MLSIRKPIIWRTHCIGDINAGRKVLPFIPQRQPITILLPENLISKASDIIVLRIVGSSMTGARLRDGDYLICRRHFEKWEIKADTICAVMIRSLNSMVAKRIRVGNKTVTLISANDDYPPETFPADDIEICAVAVGGTFYFT